MDTVHELVDHAAVEDAKGQFVTAFPSIPRQPPEISQLIYELFGVLHQLLTEAELTYWLDGGSALGCERHGGLIPWDDDGDIEMFECDQARLEEEIIQKVHQLHQVNPNTTSSGAAPSMDFITSDTLFSLSRYEFIRTYFGWKFCSRSSPLVKGRPWRYPAIDIFFVQLPQPTRVQLSPPTTAETIHSGSTSSPSAAAASSESSPVAPVRLPFSSSVAQKCWGRMNWYAHEILAPPQQQESADGLHSDSDASNDSEEIESDSDSTSIAQNRRPRPPRVYYSSSLTCLVLRPFGPLHLYAPSSSHLRSYLTRSYGADWNECAYRTFDHEHEKKLEEHHQAIKIQLQSEDRLPAAASVALMERIGETSLELRTSALTHANTTPSAGGEQTLSNHFGSFIAPVALAAAAASTSLAGKLYRDALHTIFQFLTLHEFIPACRVNHSWLAGGQTMRTRKDRLDYKGPIERLIASPLRVHIHHLVLSVMFNDNGLLLLRTAMGSHLERLDLTVLVYLLKSSPIPADGFVLPSRLREFNLTFQPVALAFGSNTDAAFNLTTKNFNTYLQHCLQQIATSSTRLETLSILFGTMAGVMNCYPQSLQTVTTLTDITLSGLINVNHQIELIKSLPRVRRWKTLGHLQPESIHRLTNSSSSPDPALPHLEQIGSVFWVDELTAQQLAHLIHLTHLDLRQMTLRDPRSLLPSFPHLVKLELHCWLYFLHDHLIEALADCTTLTHLSLRHQGLTSHQLAQFLPHLTALVHLVLCVNVTSLEFLTHAYGPELRSGFIHHLRSFALHGSPHIPFTEYHHLKAIAPTLEYLILDQSKRSILTGNLKSPPVELTPTTRPMSEWPRLPGSTVPFRRKDWPQLKNVTLILKSSLLSSTHLDPPPS